MNSLHAAGVILANDPAVIDSRQFNDQNVAPAVASFGTAGPGSTTTTLKPSSPPAVVPYVPNALAGRLRITNLEYLNEYADHTTPLYQSITRELESDIKESLQDDTVIVKVLNITAGSLVVDYRVSWNEDAAEKLTLDSMHKTMSEFLKANNNYLSSYLVDTNNMTVNRVGDACVISPDHMK